MRHHIALQAVSRLRNPAVVSLAIVGCYYGLWNAYFSSDDFWMLGWVRHQPSLSDALWTEFGYSVRMLLDAVLWIRVRWFDLDPSPYYWVSLAQHIIVSLLVYWLVGFWTRRNSVALVAALLFGTTSTHFEVVTWITASNYSLAAIAYLTALACFSLYVDRRRAAWYVASLAMFFIGLLLTELAISLPLVLLAYKLTIGREQAAGLHGIPRLVRPVTPFWVILGAYVATQLLFMHGGASEAAKAEQLYRPGLHVLSNLSYLLYLFLPPYGPAILVSLLGAPAVQVAGLALSLAGHGLAVFLLWRGSPLAKFAIAFLYLTFLPYTLWQGDFAAAIRYRYLPAIGFSILVALLLVWLHDRLLQLRRRGLHVVVPVVVTLLVATDAFLVQTWVTRHLENSSFRRMAVTQMLNQYSWVAPGTRFYIQVPADKFADIGRACVLVFVQPTQCEAVVRDKSAPVDPPADGISGDSTTYWLQASDSGLRQVFPIVAKNP